ncbi:MAG: aldose epimerase family protein [Clostridium sp.]
MMISNRIVGIYENKEVVEYNLKNSNGIEVSILNLGGIITRIITPDKDGNFENIVLSYKNKEDYFTNETYYGALIGRTAGRIGGGKAILNRKELNFDLNYNPNSGHGGKKGFDKKFWVAQEIMSESECILNLKYTSVHGEEGYPGNVDVEVKYILNNENELKLSIKATTDEDTLFNMTNHSYFNLSGNCKRTVNSSQLMMNCDEYLEIDTTGAITGKAKNCENTAFDFRVKKEIGKDINNEDIQLKLGNGYDHPFIFNNKKGRIVLEEEESGRGLKVETNNPCVVIYTTNYPGNKQLTTGEIPKFRGGICLETQAPPIASNGMFTKESTLIKGNEYCKETKYKFYISK